MNRIGKYEPDEFIINVENIASIGNNEENNMYKITLLFCIKRIRNCRFDCSPSPKRDTFRLEIDKISNARIMASYAINKISCLSGLFMPNNENIRLRNNPIK